jgi:fatty acid desaturase
MAAIRMQANEVVGAAELVRLRQRVTWKGLGLVAHAWALIGGAIALVAHWPNPLTFLLAVAIIGSRQLGLLILMHEGAHNTLTESGALNMRVSQWFCAYPMFADTKAYRGYHLTHHAHTQQPEDPDLVLSAPFPISKASYRRKFLRDITGRTGYAQRKAQVLNALGEPGWGATRRAAWFWRKLGPQCVVNAIFLAALAAAGIWWAYPLLWVLPMLTWMMVITRIRNIAEHAVVPDCDDPLRNTRTTHAGFFERLFIAPYYVNYHLEHHLLIFVPCYNLPALHRILARGTHAGRMEVQPGYAAVLRLATGRVDGPGGAKPVRAEMSDAQVSAGF